jgi:hypothetical protein
MKDSAINENNVITKVSELMETLDHLKRYTTLARSLKKFAVIIISSVAVYLTLNALLDVIRFDYSTMWTLRVILRFSLLLIPLIGLTLGVIYVRRQVNTIRTGEWKEKLSQGFPGALEVVMELDWDKILDEIFKGKLSYAIYGLLKTAAYWLITFSSIQLISNILTLYFLHRTVLLDSLIWIAFSLIIVILLLGRDLLRRYKEIHDLDMLLLELRWFSLELRSADL